MKLWQSLGCVLAVFLVVAHADPAPGEIIEKILERDEAITAFLQKIAYDQTVIIDKIGPDGKLIRSKKLEMSLQPGEAAEVTAMTTAEGGAVIPGKPSKSLLQDIKDSEKTQEEFKLRALLPRFDLKLLGKQMKQKRECYVFRFTPKDGPTPSGRLQKVIVNMEGTLFARTDDCTIMEIEATLARPVQVAWIFAVMKQLHYIYRTQPVLEQDGPESFDLEYLVHTPFKDIHQRQKVSMKNFRRPR
jgi:hypothetical protein